MVLAKGNNVTTPPLSANQKQEQEPQEAQLQDEESQDNDKATPPITSGQPKLSTTTATASDPSESEPIPDDFNTRYDRLEIATDDGHENTARKEARRLEELRAEFQRREETNRVRRQRRQRQQQLEQKQQKQLEGEEQEEKKQQKQQQQQPLEQQIIGNYEEEQGIDFVMDDLEARFQSLDVEALERGTDTSIKDKEARRLEELHELRQQNEKKRVRRQQQQRQQKEAQQQQQQRSSSSRDVRARGRVDDLNSEGDDFVLDDLQARYQSLDVDALERGSSAGMKEKEARRLEELRRQQQKLQQQRFVQQRKRREEVRSHRNDRKEVVDDADDCLDDMQARYQSLDVDALERGTSPGMKNKETRRLEELRRVQREQQNRNAEWQKMRQAQEMEEEDEGNFNHYPSQSSSTPPSSPGLDDLTSRYDALKQVSTDKQGTYRKEARRLQELKKQVASSLLRRKSFGTKKKLSSTTAAADTVPKARTGEKEKDLRMYSNVNSEVDDFEEPLRLDLLQRQTKEVSPVENKERMRIEEFQRLTRIAAEKKKRKQQRLQEQQLQRKQQQQQLQDEESEDISSDDDNDSDTILGSTPTNSIGGGDQAPSFSYKTSESRRLEDLEKYFTKRRVARLAEEKRLEQMLNEAKLEAEALTIKERKEMEELLLLERESSGSNKQQSHMKAVDSTRPDEFVSKRPTGASSAAGARSMSTTMLPTGANAIRGRKVRQRRKTSSPTTVPQSNSGTEATGNRSAEEAAAPSNVAATQGEDVDFTAKEEEEREEPLEECDPEDEECWDITHDDIFANRASQSLATTLPPLNTVRRRNVIFSSPTTNRASPERYQSLEEDEPGEECDPGDEECRDITHDDIFAKRASRSLATTLPPLNTVRPRNVIASTAPTNRANPEQNHSLEGGEHSEECDPEEDEECRDITHDDIFAKRATQSLATTLPPLNTVRPTRNAITSTAPPTRTSPEQYQSLEEEEEDPREECDPEEDEECHDITHDDIFAKRATQSLATTLPPLNTVRPRNVIASNAPLNDTTEKEALRKIGRKEEEFVNDYDNDFGRNGNNKVRAAEEEKESHSAELEVECQVEDEECWDITRNANFARRESQSLSTTLPPANKLPNTIPSPNEKSFQNAIPSSASASALYRKVRKPLETSSTEPDDRLNTGMAKQRSTAPGSFEESKRRAEEARRNRELFRSRVNGSSNSVTTSTTTKRVLGRPATTLTTILSRSAGNREEGEEYSHRNIAQNFSPDRASLLGHSPRKKVDYMPFVKRISNNLVKNNKGNSNRASKGSIDTAITTRAKRDNKATTAERGNDDDEQEHFLDTPRVFQNNVDMVSSNTSGARFKRSSAMPPEERKRISQSQDHYDITRAHMPSIDDMAMTQKSRKAVVPAEVEAQFSSTSTDEQVMSWLLTHLPKLQEEDAINYFQCFLKDGFDSLDMLSEVDLVEEDLYFMRGDHRKALLQSIETANNGENGEPVHH